MYQDSHWRSNNSVYSSQVYELKTLTAISSFTKPLGLSSQIITGKECSDHKHFSDSCWRGTWLVLDL